MKNPQGPSPLTRAIGIFIALLLPLSSGPVSLNAATLLWDSDANSTNGVSEASGTFTWAPGTTSSFLNGGTLVSTTNDLTTDIAQFGNGNALQGLATINVGTGSINGLIFGANQASAGSNYLLTNTGASTLTIGASGILMNSGAAANTVGSSNLSLSLGAAQSWTNNSTSLLTIGGALANGSNLLTLAPAANGGGITASGIISGSGGLTVNGASAGVVTLSNAANTFSGPVTLTSGILSVATLANIGTNSNIGTGDATSAATNAASLVLDGGTLRYTGASVSTSRLFTLTQNGGTIDQSPGTAANTLTFANTGNIAFSGSGARTLTLTGSGTGANVLNPVLNDNGGDVSSLTKTGAGVWNLGNAAYGYTGTTTVRAGTLTVSGTAGSILNSSQITLNGGKLLLDYTASGANAVNRIGNSTAVSLSTGGEFSVTANATASTTTSETIGLINITGGNSIFTVGAGAGAGDITNITAASFARTNNATALFRGTSLNQSAATLVSRITLTNTAGLDFVGNVTLSNGTTSDATQGIKIVPYLIGDTAVANTGSNFVTYDAGLTTPTLRVLLATEQTAMAAGTVTATNPINALAGANITLTTAVNNVTVNSLAYNTATTATTLNGTTANNTVLQVNSGAVANFNTGTFTIGAVGTGFTKLLLGNGTWNEGILTATQSALTINSPVDVTGGGGITIAGANTVTLAATALYTGATNINQGTLQFAATTGDIASSSGISLNGGTLNINRTNGITIAQNIIGTATTGGLIQNATGGTTILSGTNTYSAPTTITAGTLQFKGAGGLSPNTAISMAGTTLQIRNDGVGNNGNITLGNSVQVTATGATIDVANNGTSTGNTIAFGALAAPVGATVNTINFTGANNYNVSFSSLSLNGGAGQATTLNPTTTSVIITGNVTNPMSGFATTNFDTLTLDGTSTGNAINGKILDNVAGAFTTTLLGGYTKVLKQNTSTWTLGNAGSSYTGSTTITNGTLKAGVTNAIPLNNVQGVAITAGTAQTATFDLGSFSQTFLNTATALNLGGGAATSTPQVIGSGGSTIFLSGTGGGITYTSTNNPLGGLISVSALDLGGVARTFNVGASTTNHAAATPWSGTPDLVVSSLIQNGTLTMATGTGVLQLTNANNTYSGGTNANAGELSVASDAMLGNASGALTFNGGGLQVTGTTFNTWNSSRALNLTGAATFDIANQANTFTVGSPALTAGGNITKTGPGTLTFTNALTMGAKTLTVNDGVLQVNNAITTTTGGVYSAGGVALASNLGGGAINIGSGGSLTFSGTDTDNFNIGATASSFGSLVVGNGGSVTATRINVSQSGTGVTTFLSGSTGTFSNYIIGGRASTGQGSLTIAGGTINATALANNTGSFGGGRLEVNVGTNLGGGNTGGNLNLGTKNWNIIANTTTSQGILNLSSGTMTTNQINANAQVYLAS